MMTSDIYAEKRDERTEAVAARPPAEVDAVEFALSRLRFEADEKQAVVLRSRANRGILNCSRQWGKSTVAAIKAVHRAYTREEALVLVASPTQRQSAEFVRKASGFVRKLGIAPRGDGDNETSLMFPNGSRIVGLPGMEGNVRGFSAVSLIVIDEAAYVSWGMYKALNPMLAVGGGDLWIMSTPWGKQGFFFETWESGGPDWERVTAKATECKRIAKEFLERQRAQIGAKAFEQEYMCGFVDTGGQVFAREVLDRALDSTVEPLIYRSCWEK